jgi:monofunctional biosynthetic peptidoglycan transglycosylase
LRLRTSQAFDGVNYQHDFAPPAGVWVNMELPFEGFRPLFRGRAVADHPALDPAVIKTFGLIIAHRQQGPFRLEIESIAAYCKAGRGRAHSSTR